MYAVFRPNITPDAGMPSNINRTLDLPAWADEIIRTAISSGEHESAEEVVSAALAGWVRQRDEEDGILASVGPAEIGRLISEGLKCGPSSHLDIDDIKREARRRLDSRRRAAGHR